MPCILKIFGKKTFDIDKFIGEFPLEIISIAKKGDESTSNFEIEKTCLIYQVSKADFSDFKKQIRDAVRFLKRNNNYLEKVSSDKTVDSINLLFNFNSRIDRKKVEVQNDYFPADLIRLVGRFNMSISLMQWPFEQIKNKTKKN